MELSLRDRPVAVGVQLFAHLVEYCVEEFEDYGRVRRRPDVRVEGFDREGGLRSALAPEARDVGHGTWG